MNQLGYSVSQLARRTDLSYQCIQQLVQGTLIPSKRVVERVGTELLMDVPELATLAAADCVERKYGIAAAEQIRSCEMQALHLLWRQLSASERNIILSVMRSFLEQNKGAPSH